jgi:hypothetical protein
MFILLRVTWFALAPVFLESGWLSSVLSPFPDLQTVAK